MSKGKVVSAGPPPAEMPTDVWPQDDHDLWALSQVSSCGIIVRSFVAEMNLDDHLPSTTVEPTEAMTGSFMAMIVLGEILNSIEEGTRYVLIPYKLILTSRAA